MSFIWDVAEQKLFNAKCKTFIGDERIYAEELNTPREDKIAFVDSMTNGELSYMLDLIEKFKQLHLVNPRGGRCFNYTKAVRAYDKEIVNWMNQNDIRKRVFTTSFDLGKFYIVGSVRYIQHDRKGPHDYYDDMVDEAFHRQLKRCEELEAWYFREHDERWVLMAAVHDKIEKHRTTFGVNLCIGSNKRLTIPHTYGHRKGERELTIDELKTLMAKYEKLEALIAEETIDIVY